MAAARQRKNAPPWREGGAGVIFAALTFVAYMVGAGRAFGFDAAVTMDRFVRHEPWVAFDRQVVANNHPLFSFVESLTFDVFGGGEVAMRVLPCLFAAVAVGVLVWQLAMRLGMWPAVVGGLVVAANPVMVPFFRDVRGYSLATLAVVMMGVAVAENRPSMFAAAVFVGVGTHAVTVAPALLFVAWLWRSGRMGREQRVPLLVALVGDLLIYAWMADEIESAPMQLRFWFWLLPVIAVGAALLVDRVRWSGAVLAVALLVGAVPMVGSWADDENGNRELARLARNGDCLPPWWPNDAVAVYLPDAPRQFDCDQVVLLYPHRWPVEEQAMLGRWPEVCAGTPDGQVRAARCQAAQAP